MDVVYPLGTGSKWNDNEIRYSIRTLLKHSLEPIDKIFIVGHKPDFLKYSDRLIHIPFQEVKPKEVSIWKKVITACKDERVSEEFLFCNDDYFFIQDVKLSEFPHYHKGDMQKISWIRLPEYRLKGSYSVQVQNTCKFLKRQRLTTYHFDIHVPNRVEKKKYLEVWNKYEQFITQANGLVISSVYCNYHKLEPTYMADCKLQKTSLEELESLKELRPVFSIGDGAVGQALEEFFEKYYGTKSEFEK